MTSRHSEHPQAARLVVRVGVTGHRAGALHQLGVKPVQLQETIRVVLRQVAEIANEVATKSGSLYAHKASQEEDEPEQPLEPELRLVSALAEGADRLAADAAMQIGYSLQSVLPFSVDEYKKDFSSDLSKKQFDDLLGKATSVLELDGDPSNRSDAYLAAGRILLLQCDVLIAIWDGTPAKGVGGTAQIVDEALKLEIPTVLIDAHPPHISCLLIPGSRAEDPPLRVDLGKLDRRLEATLRLPQPDEEDHRPIGDRERVLSFFRETWPKWNFGLSYQLFRSVLGGPQENRWKLRAKFRALRGHEVASFDWADRLADAYAGRYRSSVITVYLLGAFAVFFAFFGIEHEPSSIYWFGLELVLIVLILALTFRGRRRRWHERWMDYRWLAEGLRQMKFLARIGRVPASLRVPAHLRPSDPRRSWFNWYLRAVVREHGLVHAKIDKDYLGDYRKELEKEITEQAKYHRNNHKILALLHHRLHHGGQLLFVATAIACVLHVFPLHDCILPVSLVEPAKKYYDEFLSFCAVVLPAFGAAFASILHHGEFERLCLRSKALASRLEELKKEARGAEPDMKLLSRIADDFSQVMMSELVDWRFVFLDKDLVLPA